MQTTLFYYTYRLIKIILFTHRMNIYNSYDYIVIIFSCLFWIIFIFHFWKWKFLLTRVPLKCEWKQSRDSFCVDTSLNQIREMKLLCKFLFFCLFKKKKRKEKLLPSLHFLSDFFFLFSMYILIIDYFPSSNYISYNSCWGLGRERRFLF